MGLNVWGQSPPSDQLAHHCPSPSPPLQCGVIEVVPDSKSRDQIGKQTQVSLKEYFHSCLTSIQKVLGSNPSWVLIFFRTSSTTQFDIDEYL